MNFVAFCFPDTTTKNHSSRTVAPAVAAAPAPAPSSSRQFSESGGRGRGSNSNNKSDRDWSLGRAPKFSGKPESEKDRDNESNPPQDKEPEVKEEVPFPADKVSSS